MIFWLIATAGAESAGLVEMTVSAAGLLTGGVLLLLLHPATKAVSMIAVSHKALLEYLLIVFMSVVHLILSIGDNLYAFNVSENSCLDRLLHYLSPHPGFGSRPVDSNPDRTNGQGIWLLDHRVFVDNVLFANEHIEKLLYIGTAVTSARMADRGVALFRYSAAKIRV
jgi:hypothetical protein